nr:hypothetical protein [Paenibacillus humicola]
MPIMMMVILFFIFLIRMSAAEMALHGAVSQTVRQAAADIRPAALAVKQVSDRMPDSSERLVPLPDIGEAAGKLAGWLPDPAGPLFSAISRGEWKQTLQDYAATEIGRSVVEPMLGREADKTVLNPDRVRLSKLSLPDLKDGAEPYIGLEAEYEFMLGLPFTKRSIVLREQAEERAWIADSAPAPSYEAESDGSKARIQIVSIAPNPLRPGRNAHVTVKTDPGRTVSIEVRYKSGLSTAKHLGDTAADSEGAAEWSWLVSGNTTPGVWELTVSANDGTKVSRHFIVEKSDSGQQTP